MKATELRIGNLVQFYIGPQVSEWVECVVDIGHITNSNNYKPIPLTEEWLVKFGFKSDSSLLDPPDTQNGNFWIDYIKNDVLISMPFFEFSYNELQANIELKYVHQLQNIYFALIGEELCLTEQKD